MTNDNPYMQHASIWEHGEVAHPRDQSPFSRLHVAPTAELLRSRVLRAGVTAQLSAQGSGREASGAVGVAAARRSQLSCQRRVLGRGGQWLRRALMSSSLFMLERPSMPISRARSWRSSTVQSS